MSQRSLGASDSCRQWTHADQGGANIIPPKSRFAQPDLQPKQTNRCCNKDNGAENCQAESLTSLQVPGKPVSRMKTMQ